MTTAAIHWPTEALSRQLQPLLPRLAVEVVRSTASTNTALLERARVRPEAERDANAATVHRSVESSAFGRRAIDWQPCLLIAEQQSAGRGRMGREWCSEVGASLTFSLGLPLAASEWSGLSLAIGVALCEALDPMGDNARAQGRAHVALKWPNDLWLIDTDGAGRKLGGILVETVSAGGQRLAIIGIGLNVQRFTVERAATGFAALQELDPAATAPAALAQIALPLVRALKQFEARGFAAFAERFAARDLLRGHVVTTTFPGAPEGVARGVSAQGELLVETPGGLMPVSSGEVSVRLAAGGTTN